MTPAQRLMTCNSQVFAPLPQAILAGRFPSKRLLHFLFSCVALVLFISLCSSVQALTIQIRVYPKTMYNPYAKKPEVKTQFYNTPGEAFQIFKDYWDYDSYNTDGVLVNGVRAINLQPKTPPPKEFPRIFINGVAYAWQAGWQSCTAINGYKCTITPSGLEPVYSNQICPKGFGKAKQFPDPQDYYDRKEICLKEIYLPEPCDDCGVGNPILPAGGQKLQVETDYVSASGNLSFKRSYRSTTGTFNSPAASGGLIDHSQPGQLYPNCYWGLYQNGNKLESHCFPYVSSGKPEYQLLTPEGRLISFAGPADAIKPNPGFNDKLTRRLNQQAQTEWLLQRSDNSFELYNQQGLLQSKTTPDGSTTTYTYSDANTPAHIAPKPGLLLSVTDSQGRALQLNYDPQGRLKSLTDPAQGLTQYTYDAIGNLIKRSNPDNTERLYHYNEAANINNGLACNSPPLEQARLLTGLTDENGTRLADYHYNCEGKAISTQHTGGLQKYSFTYSGYTSATEIDPLGTTRKYSFSEIAGSLRPTSTTQPGPNGQGTVTSTRTYDPQGNIASQIDFTGSKTCHSHDLSRNLETVRIEGLPAVNACPANAAAYQSVTLPTPAPGASITQRKISTQWHPELRLKTKQAQPNLLTTWVYHGQPDPSAGNAIASCAPQGALLPDGKPIAVLCKHMEQATTDSTGSNGFAAPLAPNTPARVWSYTYNEKGQVLTADGPRSDNGILDKTLYSYHPATTEHVRQGDLASITNAAGQTTTFTQYDPHGRVLKSTDAYGMTTLNTYHARGWLLSSKRIPAGIAPDTIQANTFEYDATGQLMKAITAQGGTITYSYDAAHRLIGITDSFGNSISYTLDAMGNRLQEQTKDPNAVLAQQVTRILDALNRVQQTTGGAQ